MARTQTPGSRPPLPSDAENQPERHVGFPPSDPLATLSRRTPAAVLFLLVFLVLLAVYVLTAHLAHEPARLPSHDALERLTRTYPEEDFSDLRQPGQPEEPDR